MLVIRWLLFGLFFIPYSIFLSILGRYCHNFAWFIKPYQKLTKFWNCWILWTINISVAISAADQAKLKSQYSKIIIANHQSHLDSLVLWAIIPEDVLLCFAAKKELFKIPIFGKILYYSGSIVINRENPERALQNLRDFFVNTKLAKTLVVYAEGTRSKTKNLLPFKRGPFIVAHEMAVPLLPIVIHGTAELLPSGARWPRSGSVSVNILETLPAAVSSQLDANQLKNTIWQQMKQVLLQSY